MTVRLGQICISSARYEYECKYCERIMKIGEQYVSRVGHAGKAVFTTRYHVGCVMNVVYEAARKNEIERDGHSASSWSRKKLLYARYYALRTGNTDRVNEINKVLEASAAGAAKYRGRSAELLEKAQRAAKASTESKDAAKLYMESKWKQWGTAVSWKQWFAEDFGRPPSGREIREHDKWLKAAQDRQKKGQEYGQEYGYNE